MALPGDNPNAVNDAVAAEIKESATKDLASLPSLQAEDLALFGTLVQHFAFMDLNLRGLLNLFHAENMLPNAYAKFWPMSLPDSKLAEALGAVIGAMDPAKEDVPEALLWVQVIDSTRLKRNLVSHFAGKRHVSHDVYIFASKSYKDAKKVLGVGLAHDEVHLVVTPRIEFAEMVESARSAQDWLAKKVPEWHERYGKK